MHGSVEWAMYFLFGMSGWWVYNTLSAEQPIFTACNTTLPTGLTADNSSANVNCTLPEGPALASQISVTSQLGNIVPLLYRGIVKYCCSAKEDVAAGGKRKLCTCARSLRVPVVILASMLTGLFAAILASFEWQTGTYVFGEEHSLVLLLCCFLSGGLGCMSSIIYWQFASMYSHGIGATKALSIGMAAGGLFPCILAVLQNLSELWPNLQDAYFSPTVMLWISGGVQLLFIGLFLFIWCTNKKEQDMQAAVGAAGGLGASGARPSTDSRATDEWSRATDSDGGAGGGGTDDGLGGEKVMQRPTKRPPRPPKKRAKNKLVHTPSSMAVVFGPDPSPDPSPKATYQSKRKGSRGSRSNSVSSSHRGSLEEALLGDAVAGEMVDPVATPSTRGADGLHAAAAADDDDDSVFDPVFDLQMQDESQKREHLLSMGTNPDERAPRPKKRKKKYPASGKCNYTDVLPTLIVAVLYFCTYSLPALIPIIIHRFHNYKSLYILVNFGYTVGDFMGRMVTVLPCIPGWATLQVLTIVVFGLFIVQILAAVFWKSLCASLDDPSLQPPSLINNDTYEGFGYCLVAIQFCYYFLRGYVVTNTYVRIKADYDSDSANLLAGAAGTVGQVGAALGTLIVFILVSVVNVFDLPS